MINITLNGKKEELSPELTILDLLKKKNLRPEVVTVEHNERILSREEFSRVIIKDKDMIELVFFMGGGQ